MIKSIIMDGRKIFYREETTDMNIIKEIFVVKTYNRVKMGFGVVSGERWLDLGANIGAFGAFVVNKGGSVVSYEPEPSNFAMLKKNVPESKSIMSAVSTSKEKFLQFYSNKKGLKHSRVTNVPNQIQIPYKKLHNAYAKDVFKEFFDGVKIDIEGSELDMFDKAIVPNCNKLVMEYHFGKDKSIKNFKRRIKFLRKHFSLVTYPPGFDRPTEHEQETGKFDVWYDHNVYCMK